MEALFAPAQLMRAHGGRVANRPRERMRKRGVGDKPAARAPQYGHACR